MPKSANQPSPYQYISYVTMREVWELGKTYFLIWIFFSVFSVVLGGLFKVGIDTFQSNTETSAASFPRWILGAVIISVCFWYMKGQEIKFKFPELNLKSWLFLTAFIFVSTFVFTELAWWIGAPFYFGIIIVGVLIDDLSAKGKENYTKLNLSHEQPA